LSEDITPRLKYKSTLFGSISRAFVINFSSGKIKDSYYLN